MPRSSTTAESARWVAGTVHSQVPAVGAVPAPKRPSPQAPSKPLSRHFIRGEGVQGLHTSIAQQVSLWKSY
jgi:hypothetical protein